MLARMVVMSQVPKSATTSGSALMTSSRVMIASKNAQLVDDRQNFIENGKTDQAYAGAAAVYTRMINGETGVDEYSYSTGDRICAFRPVMASDGWSVGAVAPAQEMTSSVLYIIAALLATSLVCMVLGVLLVGRYVTSVTNPIRSVTERMRLLAQGDLSSEVKISQRKDEIGILSGAFYETVESLKSYIKDIENVLREISQGNLQVAPQADFRGEFTEIRKSLDQILDSLNETFKQILDSASQVSGSAGQFSSGAQALSQGATEQASSVEELAATISEISAAISSNARSAAEVNDHMHTVGQGAEESNRQMSEMLKAMISQELRRAVMSDIILLSLVGIRVAVVHGGGPEIGAMLKRLGKESRFVDGLRYTDEETMDVVQQILCGKVNKDLVSLAERLGGQALGLCGLDGGLLEAELLDEKYGLVGKITSVNPKPVEDSLSAGYIPIVSTVAQGTDADTAYNINADTAAAKLAEALQAEKLILLTDVRGLLRDPHDETTLIHEVRVSEVQELVNAGVISGGMIPKIECCVEAISSGVERVHILDGRIPHSILIELLSDAGIGTMLKKED